MTSTRRRWLMWLARRAERKGNRLLADAYRAICDGTIVESWEP